MGCVRPAERVFFPLDEELALLPGVLTPSLQEDLVHLGAWMPFAQAAQELWHFRRAEVSRWTAARLTEAAGAAYVGIQEGEVRRIEQELPAPPPGPAQQLVSVDGAMVPLVGGEWTEVKTLVIGDVQPAQEVKGEQVIRTGNHSYFSRLSDAATFQRLALVETQRRGVETAGAVAAVTDGAEWIQKFVDHHRPDAVRILDFPHAAEYLSTIAQEVWGEGSAQARSWLAQQCHQLKHKGPVHVLAAVREVVAAHHHRPELVTALTYLEKREAHMQYPAFQAAGWPIGDGVVESANKLVVEARLKGSGMHWARAHVDPMLALRNIACNDRWDEAWPQIAHAFHLQDCPRRKQRRKRRQAAADPPQPLPPPPVCAPQPLTPITPPPSDPPPVPPLARPPWRPPADHPWRRMPVGRARYKPHLN